MKNYFFTILTTARILIRRYFRDRTALFFAILFPIIFLVIFGGLYSHNSISFNVDVINNSKSAFSYQFIADLNKSGLFNTTNTKSLSADENSLEQTTKTDAILVFPNSFGRIQNGIPTGTVQVYYDKSNVETAQGISSAVTGILSGVNTSLTHYNPPLKVDTVSTGGKGVTGFDFIFAGMLGFTVVILGLLGPSQSIPEYKKMGILRRLHTTPVSAAQYVIATLLQSTVVALISIIILFVIGLNFYHLVMAGSYLTLAVFLIFSIATIFGIGLAIGGWAKNQETAAPLTNIISFPMMFLSGTFFPTYLMPIWLQNISRYLPLSPIITGIRYIVTDNRNLTQLGPELLIMAVWLVIIYIIAFIVFSWE